MGHGTSMDLTGADSPDNEYLMAVSCIIDKAVVSDHWGGADPTGDLQALMNSIRSDLEDDGDISDELKAEIRAADASLNPNVDCIANLAAYLEEQTGTVPELPDPDQAADMDGDGVPNALDDDIDGDGVDNSEDTDPWDAAVGGALWEDDATGLVWQRYPSDALLHQGDATSYCDALVLGGFDDWRLPSVSELRSLVQGCAQMETGGACGVTDGCDEYSCYSSSCSGCPDTFGPGPGGCYWDPELGGTCYYFMSSSYADDLLIPWVIDFRTTTLLKDDVKADTYDLSGAARCVRVATVPDAGL